ELGRAPESHLSRAIRGEAVGKWLDGFDWGHFCHQRHREQNGHDSGRCRSTILSCGALAINNRMRGLKRTPKARRRKENMSEKNFAPLRLCCPIRRPQFAIE